MTIDLILNSNSVNHNNNKLFVLRALIYAIKSNYHQISSRTRRVLTNKNIRKRKKYNLKTSEYKMNILKVFMD